MMKETVEVTLLKGIMQEGFTSIPNILFQNYRKLGLSSDEFLLLLQFLVQSQTGQSFPDLKLLAQRMEISDESVFSLIQSLLDKKIIKLDKERDASGKVYDQVNYDFLWEKLEALMIEAEQPALDSSQAGVSEKDLLKAIQEEFGRSLSPIELETVGMWIDQDGYDLELIYLSLKEAVLNNAYSLKYMDRILLTWEKKNIRTKDDAHREISRHRKNWQGTANGQKEKTGQQAPVPLHNWLEDQEEDAKK